MNDTLMPIVAQVRHADLLRESEERRLATYARRIRRCRRRGTCTVDR